MGGNWDGLRFSLVGGSLSGGEEGLPFGRRSDSRMLSSSSWVRRRGIEDGRDIWRCANRGLGGTSIEGESGVGVFSLQRAFNGVTGEAISGGDGGPISSSSSSP